MPDAISLLPAVVAIGFVVWKKEVIGALALAIFTSECLLVISGGTPLYSSLFGGFIATAERIVAVFSDAGNTRVLTFSMLIGALLAFMRVSGGVSATVQGLINSGIATNQRRAGLMTFITGVVVFIESNLSALTAGILSRGLFDRFNMSRERLAYIVDSTSAPICILILLNGWGAFVLGLIAPYDMGEAAVSVLVSTIPLNFYALSTLVVVFYTVWTGKVYGPLARSESNPESSPVVSEVEFEPGRIRDMLVPLSVLVFGMLAFMVWTGNGDMMSGSGSKSVLYATLLAIIVAFLMLIQLPQFTHRSLVDHGFKGISEILPLVAILLLAIALGASVKQLGTGIYISGLVADYLPLWAVPAVIFIAGAFASFTTGTSWGTFALLVPIAIPIAINLDLPPALILSAVLGGGIFGDHCSPVSDTTAVSSLAAGCDLLDHVKTQLPYALFCGGFTIIAYLITGLMLVG